MRVQAMIALLILVTLLAIGAFLVATAVWPQVSHVRLALVVFVIYLIAIACIAAWIYQAAYALPDGAVVLEPPPKP